MVTVKTVGNNGQISLGKEYAGRHVLVDQAEKGLWVIKAGTFVPDSEAWLLDPKLKSPATGVHGFLTSSPSMRLKSFSS